MVVQSYFVLALYFRSKPKHSLVGKTGNINDPMSAIIFNHHSRNSFYFIQEYITRTKKYVTILNSNLII